MEEFKIWITGFLAGTGKSILIASVILTAGFLAVKIAARSARVALQRTPIERTTVSFIVSIINFSLYAVVIYFAAEALVPDVSAGLIAVLGSAALAVGLALKDSVGDFAGGVMIIFNKPFKEGDYIEVDGCEGTIRSIHLLYTVVYTSDNKKIVINNSRVASNRIINYSARPTRRVDLEFSAGYGSDIEKVKKVLADIAAENPLILDNPQPLIRLYRHGESALIFRFRVWVDNENYWTVWYDVNEKVYEKFKEEGIEIPFRNVTLHIDKPEDSKEVRR